MMSFLCVHADNYDDDDDCLVVILMAFFDAQINGHSSQQHLRRGWNTLN